MTAYRAGQRVRVDLRDGSAIEATVTDMNGHPEVALYGRMVVYRLDAMPPDLAAHVTVLSEPRPDEPTGLGAVVRAGIGNWEGRIWVRTFSGYWATDEPIASVEWNDLTDPVVLSEGWTP